MISLSSGTTYYFNVLVRDEAGNEAAFNADGLGQGGALYNDRGMVTLINTIAWKNSVSQIETNVDITVQYSDIEGGFGDAADMNLDDDPLFMEPDAGNFRLRTGSPCIDKGTSTAAVTLPAVDIEGTARPVGIAHDMGAYEYAAGKDISVPADSLDFGTTNIGTTASLDITLSNTGDQDLVVSDIALSDDSHYAVSHASLPITIAPAGEVSVTVDFTPTAVGQHDAQLNITSNDPDESPLAVDLTGTGAFRIYIISATAGSGGTITPAGSIPVTEGQDQSFTIAADSGYAIADVLVDGASVGAVTSYAFNDVAAGHAIEARFAPLTGGISVSALSGDTDESGTIATFTVVLTRAPAGNVQIPVASDDTTEATLSTDMLTFTPFDWDTSQTVIVTGVDDAMDDDDQTFNIVIGPVQSSDTGFDGEDPDDLTGLNIDFDTAGIRVGAISGDTDETGATATFAVVLNSEPAGDVEIQVSSNDLSEGTVSPDRLVFTPADWDTPQTVTVIGVDDGEADGDVDYAITFAATTSTDSQYNGITLPWVVLTNIDDDSGPAPNPDDPDTGGSGGGGGGGGCFISSVAGF